MSIGELHATLGKPVEIWRVDFGFGVVAGYVAIAHVISKNQHHVGLFVLGKTGTNQQQGAQKREDGFH